MVMRSPWQRPRDGDLKDLITEADMDGRWRCEPGFVAGSHYQKSFCVNAWHLPQTVPLPRGLYSNH